MLLHLKCTFANHQPYWLNNNSEFHLSLCTGSIIYLFSFTKPTLFNSENLRENILLIILSYPPINSLSCNSRQMFSFANLPYFLIKRNSFETNNYKRTVFDMFIPKLNSQQTHPTAFHFLSFLFLSSPYSFFMYTPALQGRSTRSLNMYPAVMIWPSVLGSFPSAKGIWNIASWMLGLNASPSSPN